MTAATLLALIAAALLLQVAAGVAWTILRTRGSAGAVLPPAAPAPVRADAAWPGWREFRVSRRRFEDAAQTQCSFELQPVDGQALPPFRPGQFLTFALDVPVRGADGSTATRTITRCYSLSDRPDPQRYRITVKRVPAPAGPPALPPGLASGHFHDHVQVGDILRVKAPAGAFFIDPDADLPVVLIAGGIGITPMMSMLAWCVAQQPQRRVHLFYGVRNSREQAFKQPLEALAAVHPALQLHIVYSQPGACDVPGRDHRHEGHVDIDLLRRTLPHGRHAFYVCGPAAMMQTLVPALAAWGVAPGDLHHEAFGPASVKTADADAARGSGETAAAAGTDLAVRFRRSGRTVTWDGRDASLLDFAERHGIAVESACRSGGCGSCETRLLEGSVRYAQDPDHAVAPGHCLLCVGRPASPLVLEA